MLLRLNIVVNLVRRRLDLPYWSLSKVAKHKVKNAVEFISRFEEAVAHEAARLGVDGVVCGHIHTAETRRFGEITYYNDGDWVESCTALVEHDAAAWRSSTGPTRSPLARRPRRHPRPRPRRCAA